jgi:hypothetical protein
MKIIDRTPYRNESGVIDIMGRIRGSLQYGLTWFASLQAQEAVIAILDKVLKEGFVLVRNATLPNTEISLPLVILAPQGVFLVNVIHEHGVFRARDEEWGTVSGEKFVPAAVNQIQRTIKLGRVLQLYLDRNGFKDQLVVETLIMSADPGTHIDSTRPAIRIIMSDALERFAISLGQGRPVLNADTVFKITKMILDGPTPKAEAATPASGSKPVPPAVQGDATPDDDDFRFSFTDDEPPLPARPAPQARPTPPPPSAAPKQTFQDNRYQESGSSASAFQDQGFQFQDDGFQANAFRDDGFGEGGFQANAFQDDSFREGGFQASAFPDDRFQETGFQETSSQGVEPPQKKSPVPAFAQPQPASKPAAAAKSKAPAPKKKGLFGFTRTQVIILAAILLAWLCLIVGFFVFITYA